MSSYLSSRNRGKTLESLEDIVLQKLKLWASIPWNPDEDTNRAIYPGVYDYKDYFSQEQFVQNVSREIFDKHLYDFAWKHIHFSQSLLKRKIFSFSKMCPIGGYLYPINIIFDLVHMEKTIDIFYIRILESGLFYISEQLTYLDINYNIVKDFEIQFSVLYIILKYFEIVWIILGFGLLISILVFILEIYYKNGKL